LSLPDLAIDLACGLDPVAFAEGRLGFHPDPWQRDLLRSNARQVILNITRQGGKSTATSILGLHCAIYEPGALVLLVSPSQRQSRELFAKTTGFLKAIEPVVGLEEDNRLSATLANKSRIVSLPGDARTVRGFSAPKLVVADEAAYVADDLFTAIRPMLAVSEGRLILMSTPAGRRGVFFQTWERGEGWLRIRIPASQCPRISAEFLEQERRELGPMLFSQE
jgi:phage terminase large subunit-like protein